MKKQVTLNFHFGKWFLIPNYVKNLPMRDEFIIFSGFSFLFFTYQVLRSDEERIQQHQEMAKQKQPVDKPLQDLYKTNNEPAEKESSKIKKQISKNKTKQKQK